MQDLLEQLAELLKKREIMLTTAESCTGGLLAATITGRPGASGNFERGFVTYSNESKSELLDVPEDMIEQHGAVSPQVAEAMATGALKHSRAGIAIAITGVAGPDGGSEDKPVGLVYFGYALKDGTKGSIRKFFPGTRIDIQTQATSAALKELIFLLGGKTDL